MNTKNLLVASLAGGLISTVLANTPYLKLINLLVCVGFWIGPLMAIWIYRRLGGTLTLGQAVLTGILAGAWHGLIGLALSPLGLAGVGSFLNDARAFIPAEDLSEAQVLLSGAGGLLLNLVGVVLDVIFGAIGGLLGGLLFHTRQIVA